MSAAQGLAMSVDHYENFPVASWLCPPALRPAVSAIYWFARTADDIADEGQASPSERLAELARYRAALQTISSTKAHQLEATQVPWPQVFVPLAKAIDHYQLPTQHLHDLLSAFEQDIHQTRWPDRAALMDYASRSANPVGRLLLHLYSVTDSEALARSDAICTALQLINFWQDVSVDAKKDRIYLPQNELAAAHITEGAVLNAVDSPATRALILDLCDWSQQLMQQGLPLVHQVPGRAGWELRLVVQGGLRIIDHIRQLRGATVTTRPRLSAWDVPFMMIRALRM